MELGKVFRTKVELHLFYKTYKTWSKAYASSFNHFVTLKHFLKNVSFFHIDLNMLVFIQFQKSYKC